MTCRRTGIAAWLILLTVFLHSTLSRAQTLIDQVVATVGNQIILRSDIEKQYMQYLAQGGKRLKKPAAGSLTN